MSATTPDTIGTARDREAAARTRARLRSLVRGRTADPAWVRPALLSLLAATALLYLVDLAASGWANGFYSAAVQAGTKSWKAFFFGSFDSSNFITVDKSPAALWPMEISARIFGVNSWSILAPQALEGVASVALLYLAVRRRFTPAAGLLAGVVLASTPVAALMFRFNNPDALLTLLLVGSAYALTRALEHASWRWLLLVGTLIGFGFLAKMLQSLLVVPGFTVVYLVMAPATLWRRVAHLLSAGVAMVAAAGWWVAIVELWPASSRPYIGGSQDNSILNLIFGYNGFGRLTGNESGSVIGGRTVGGGGGQGGGMWGATGITRLFGSEMGTQISWLLPAALFLCGVMLWATRRGGRTDGRRAAVLIWGSWLVVSGLMLSFAKGIIHPYYTVALAPAIGALVGIGVTWAWLHREEIVARLALAATVAMTSVWAFVLLDRTPDWQPWLRFAIVVGGLTAAVALAIGPALWQGNRMTGRLVLAFALVMALAAPAAYAVQTASTAHSGSLPSAGPAGSVGMGGPGGGGRGFPGGQGGPGAGGFQGGGAPPTGGGFQGGGTGTGQAPAFGNGTRPTGATRGRQGGLGGLLDSSTPSKALVSALRKNASSYRWVAAVVGANSAAGVQLASDSPVMAIGGFNGTDPSPTLAQFKAYVAAGKIHYFLSGGTGGGGGGVGSSQSSSAIATWVADHYTATTVGGVTLYDLTATASSTAATSSSTAGSI
jgi:4-amino-4-deoxy-L-arabinose transferase-like glycosyltransferase